MFKGCRDRGGIGGEDLPDSEETGEADPVVMARERKCAGRTIVQFARLLPGRHRVCVQKLDGRDQRQVEDDNTECYRISDGSGHGLNSEHSLGMKVPDRDERVPRSGKMV